MAQKHRPIANKEGRYTLEFELNEGILILPKKVLRILSKFLIKKKKRKKKKKSWDGLKLVPNTLTCLPSIGWSKSPASGPELTLRLH